MNAVCLLACLSDWLSIHSSVCPRAIISNMRVRWTPHFWNNKLRCDYYQVHLSSALHVQTTAKYTGRALRRHKRLVNTFTKYHCTHFSTEWALFGTYVYITVYSEPSHHQALPFQGLIQREWIEWLVTPLGCAVSIMLFLSFIFLDQPLLSLLNLTSCTLLTS